MKKTLLRIMSISLGVVMLMSSVYASSGRKKEGIMYTEGLPIVDPGTYSFTLFVDDSREDNDYFMFPLLEEQTGVKVEVINYPYTIAQEKLVLSLNSGDYADCIGGWLISQNDILTLGVDEGVYIPLDEYFEEYCPKITEILEIDGVRDIMTTPDGHIYSIPYVLEAPLVPYQPFINTEWLENLDLEIPTTTEEFKEVLRAFKEQDANGNGNKNDEIPFSADPDNRNLGLLCGWFGVSVDKYGFTMVGDQLTYGANTEEFKEGIKFLAELYAEGLIDPELFTQDKAQWKAKGAQDVYGVSHMYASGDIMPYDPGVVPHWEAVPVLSSPNTPNPVYLRNTYGSDVLKTQVVITDKAKNPEVIARWWDNFFDFNNVAQSQKGAFDVTLFIDDDGSYRQIDVSKMSEEDQKLYEWGHLFPQSLPKYVPNGFRFKEDVPMYEEKPVSDALYEPYLTEYTIPKYWAKSEDATKLADLSTAIERYLAQKIAEWVSGQTDVESDWNNYISQLNKLKLQDYIDLRLKALS